MHIQTYRRWLSPLLLALPAVIALISTETEARSVDLPPHFALAPRGILAAGVDVDTSPDTIDADSEEPRDEEPVAKDSYDQFIRDCLEDDLCDPECLEDDCDDTPPAPKPRKTKTKTKSKSKALPKPSKKPRSRTATSIISSRSTTLTPTSTLVSSTITPPPTISPPIIPSSKDQNKKPKPTTNDTLVPTNTPTVNPPDVVIIPPTVTVSLMPSSSSLTPSSSSLSPSSTPSLTPQPSGNDTKPENPPTSPTDDPSQNKTLTTPPGNVTMPTTESISTPLPTISSSSSITNGSSSSTISMPAGTKTSGASTIKTLTPTPTSNSTIVIPPTTTTTTISTPTTFTTSTTTTTTTTTSTTTTSDDSKPTTTRKPTKTTTPWLPTTIEPVAPPKKTVAPSPGTSLPEVVIPNLNPDIPEGSFNVLLRFERVSYYQVINNGVLAAQLVSFIPEQLSSVLKVDSDQILVLAIRDGTGKGSSQRRRRQLSRRGVVTSNNAEDAILVTVAIPRTSYYTLSALVKDKSSELHKPSSNTFGQYVDASFPLSNNPPTPNGSKTGNGNNGGKVSPNPLVGDGFGSIDPDSIPTGPGDGTGGSRTHTVLIGSIVGLATVAYVGIAIVVVRAYRRKQVRKEEKKEAMQRSISAPVNVQGGSQGWGWAGN